MYLYVDLLMYCFLEYNSIDFRIGLDFVGIVFVGIFGIVILNLL